MNADVRTPMLTVQKPFLFEIALGERGTLHAYCVVAYGFAMTSFVKNTSTAAAMQAKRFADEQHADETRPSPDQAYRGVTPAVASSAASAVRATAPAPGNVETAVDIIRLTAARDAASQPGTEPFRILSSANGVSDYSILTGGAFESAKILMPGVDDMISTLGAISKKMASAVSDGSATSKQSPQSDTDAAEISNRASAIHTRHQLAVQQLSPAQGGTGFTLRLFR